MARRTLLSHFADLPDPRVDRTKKHRLDEILMIALAAMVGGARSFEEIGAFGEAYEDWFRKSLRLKLANGVPSHDTIYRVLAALDRKTFAECFGRWAAEWAATLGITQIAIDGKSLRGAKGQHLQRLRPPRRGVGHRGGSPARPGGRRGQGERGDRDPRVARHAAPERRPRHHRRGRLYARELPANPRQEGRLSPRREGQPTQTPRGREAGLRRRLRRRLRRSSRTPNTGPSRTATADTRNGTSPSLRTRQASPTSGPTWRP